MSTKTRTFKIPETLSRTASIIAPTEERKEVRVSISSDVPYLRYDWMQGDYYWEVLDHAKMHTERLKDGLPMLWNHDSDQHLGRASDYACDGKKCDVGGLVWAAGEFATNKKADVESGALRTTSVGYRVDEEGEEIGEKDGYPIVRFGFTPHEFSWAPVPADISVGYGRSLTPGEKPQDPAQFREIQVREKKSVDEKPNDGKKGATPKAMLTKPGQKFHEEADDNKGGVSVEVVAERERAAVETHKKAEKARVTAIREFTKGFNRKANLKQPIEALETKAIDEEMDVDSYRALVLDNWTDAVRVEGADAQGEIGMSKREIRQFSFSKFLVEAHMMKGGHGQMTGIEKEASEAAVKKYGRDNRPGGFGGFCIPHDVMARQYAEVHDLDSRGMAGLYDGVTRAEELLGRSQNATSFSAGGFTVGVNLLAGSYIDYLRNARLIGQGPFSILEISGATGNVAIPKQTSTITTYWLAETATVSESNFAGGQLLFSPKRLVARNSFSKQLLAQGTPSIEMLVRNDMALAQGVEEDRASINGTGLNGEPLGIVNTSGINAGVTFSGNWTQAKSLVFELALENANVRTGEMAFLTSPTTKSYARGTPQVSASTFPIYIWMQPDNGPVYAGVRGGVVNGYPAYATKNAPTTNVVIFGVWQNNFTQVRWAGMDVVVNPFTGDASELIYVTMTQWMDFGIRYPQAFSVSTDAPTNVS